jgi:hypothetical protein
MMQRKIFAAGLVACALWTGCASDTQTPPPAPVHEPDASQIKEELPLGFHTKVFAIGYPWHGETSTEWELHEEYIHDDAGHEIYHKLHYSTLAECDNTFFDSTDHETLTIHFSANPADIAEFRTTWSADYTEKVTTEYNSDDQPMSVTKSWFDKNGLQLRQETSDNHVPEATQVTKNRMVYDAKGHLLEVYESIHAQEILGTRHTYDARGYCIKTEHFDADGKPSQIETFTFDAQGHKLDRHLQDFGAYHTTVQLEARYEYDELGLLLREMHFSGQCDAAGEQSGRCLISETITRTYDDQARPVTEVREKGGASPATMRKRFEYSSDQPALLDATMPKQGD